MISGPISRDSVAIPAAICRSAQGPGRKVPPGVLFECFWAPGPECPQRVLFECFLAFLGLKSALWGSRRQVPKNTQKALRGQFLARRGKLTRPFCRAFQTRPFFYRNGRFASRLLLLGIRFLEASKKAHLSFKSPSLKSHLNRTGSVFALPNIARYCDTIAAIAHIARYI